MKLSVHQMRQFARDVFKAKRRKTAGRLINPKRDWAIGLFLAVCILVGIMSWSAYMYVTNRSGDGAEISMEPTRIPTYRAAAVAEALDTFNQKETGFNDLQNNSIITIPEPEPIEIQSTTTDSIVATSTATTSQEVVTDNFVEDMEIDDLTPVPVDIPVLVE